jgi:hypothetical protein
MKKILLVLFTFFKKDKCLKRGITIKGKSMNAFMSQFINIFKENLI